MIGSYIKRNIKLAIAKKKWRKINKHNFTRIDSLFDFSLVSIGKGTYGTIKVLSTGNKSKVEIGSYCSISDDVTFIINNDHPTDLISTFPFRKKIFNYDSESISKGNITIGDDVWIGYGCTILSGVKIGQGAVLGSGSVVTKDVPPYAIVGGVPAKVLKYRFNEEQIEKLNKIDFSSIDYDFISKHIDDLYVPVNKISDFSWLPQKTI